MRKFILLGVAGLLALGAAGADAQSILSRPSSSSSYALLSQRQGSAALTEGRSVFINENADNAAPSGGR
jgi:hypothetical protein